MENDLSVAKELIEMWGLSLSPVASLSSAAKEALDEIARERGRLFDERKDCYYAALRICLKYDSAESHKLAYEAYHRMPATYRTNAIKELERAIELGANSAFDVYRLGLNLADDHQFDAAVQRICEAIALEPHNPLFYVWLARTLVKLNKIDDAIDMIHKYQQSKYYTDDLVMTCIGHQKGSDGIDRELQDLEEKKARGYVYRPRKTKSE